MVRFFRYPFLQSARRVNVTILALALLSGYVSGAVLSGFSDSVLFQLMRTGAVNRVSIVSALPVLLLPFLASALAVYAGNTWFLLPVAFFKALLFSYLCSAVLSRFPDSGLLFSALFLCVDFLSMPVLCWLWLRCIRNNKAEFRVMIPAVLLIVGIAIFDYQVVSPFLASLLS